MSSTLSRSLKQRRFCSSEGQKHGPASHRHRIISHSSVGCAGLRQTQMPGLLSGFTTSLWWCGTHFLWPASLPKETLPMTTKDKAVFPAVPVLLYRLPTKLFTVKCTTVGEYKPFLRKHVFTFVRAGSLSRVQRRDAALCSLLP